MTFGGSRNIRSTIQQAIIADYRLTGRIALATPGRLYFVSNRFGWENRGGGHEQPPGGLSMSTEEIRFQSLSDLIPEEVHLRIQDLPVVESGYGAGPDGVIRERFGFNGYDE